MSMLQDEALVDYEADEEEEEEDYIDTENDNDDDDHDGHDKNDISSDKVKNAKNASDGVGNNKESKDDVGANGGERSPEIKDRDRQNNDRPSTYIKRAPLTQNAQTAQNDIARSKPLVKSGNSSYGVYMPPFRRRQLNQQKIESEKAEAALSNNQEEGEVESDKTVSIHIQRQKWEDLKKAINGTINRLNNATIKELIHSLFQNANLIRGKGLLAKSLLRAATTSPNYAPVYASLIAVINTKLPEIGELVLVRSILTFRKSYSRQDRSLTMSITNFIGCLFNQGLCHELLILQLLTVLLDGDPTDDSVEVAVQLTKIVGMALAESSPAGIHAVMERFRNLLHDGSIGRRVQYKIEELIKIRKKRFKEFPALVEELDLVEREEQIVFEISLDDEELKKDDGLDLFKFDPNYIDNENDWIAIQKEILGDDSSDDNDSSDGSGKSETDDSDDDDSDDDDDEDGVLEQAPTAPKMSNNTQMVIHDMTEKDLINLRRKIYLTITSSATFEECAHKLSKLSIPPGKEMELINMIIECCSQERTFLRFYGLIASRFCLLNPRWREAFHESFLLQYNTIHRLETNKLRNVAKLFAHLLHTDSLPWSCLAVIHLNEDETTSSSRIFLKILVQEMAEAMGIGGLVKRFETDDPEVMEWYKEMFPKDNPRKTRYAINFFTSIGLGPLTDGLREYLKNAPKLIMMQAEAEAEAKRLAIENASSDDSSSVSSSSASSISSSSVSSSSSSSYTSSSSSSYTSSSSSSSSSSGESSIHSRMRRGSRSGRRGSGRNNRPSSRSRKTDKQRSRRHRSVSSSRSDSVSVKGKRGKNNKTKDKGKDDDEKDSNRGRDDSKRNGNSKRNRRSRSVSSSRSDSISVKDKRGKNNKTKDKGRDEDEKDSNRGRDDSKRNGNSKRNRRSRSVSSSRSDSISVKGKRGKDNKTKDKGEKNDQKNTNRGRDDTERNGNLKRNRRERSESSSSYSSQSLSDDDRKRRDRKRKR